MPEKSDLGLIGLAVMGENLALNIESKGYSLTVYNRSSEKTERFVSGRAAGKRIRAAYSLKELCGCLSSPRTIMLMVKAGSPVDELINELLPLLDPGDIIIDGGNSHFSDTIRRAGQVEKAGMYYIGVGVSGGEEGALKGPSLMPGGSAAARGRVMPLFEAICAKTPSGEPCCAWVGDNGAGHFVKMVHNGIEYGDMQLICEAYQLMKQHLSMSYAEMHDVFARWNRGRLKSYLIEITRDILGHEEDGESVLDRILDTAGQKGTGKWTAETALDEGVPLTLIGEAVFARCLSAMKEERVVASGRYRFEAPSFTGDRDAAINDIECALYASKIISYAQGYMLMRSSSKTFGWDLDYASTAMMWQGGCIIRSAFLGEIRSAFERDPDLQNLLLDDHFADEIRSLIPGWRRTVAMAVSAGIPAPAFSGALSWFDGWRSERLPADLLQAQRDYFGAHGYERVDRPRGELYHTKWRHEDE
ncbi:MAG: decarboxylating NADP(+)-dependent phosphogluconate dehydrogenase [Oscillospiraceae bacterium]|nr:decarboxylating NADP(+)-dependent phosphogluconate dehydrogenase [Oscillospiraceae bacterium]